MIDLKALEQKSTGSEKGFFEKYRQSLSARNGDPTEVDRLLALNERRKKLISDVETKKAEQNRVSQEIAILKKNRQDAQVQLDAMKSLSEEIKRAEIETERADSEVRELLSELPNMSHSSVPEGKTDADNRIERTHGSPKGFSFKPKEHWELGENLGIFDFGRASKVAGARFSILKGAGALLERGLIQMMLDIHTREHGYTETIPPFIVNANSLFGTGQFPKFKTDVFQLAGLEYYLIPTAEVPVTNYFRDEMLAETDLPIKFTAYTPCFRSEAGSYGRDTKGLIRQHQFNKVELVWFAHPDRSYEEHEKLVKNAEEILKRLELSYQVATLCSGDIGFSAAKCYDINVWLPGQNAFREISSCSNCEDFQARRANIRFRPSGGGKPQFVHTLNGSGLAVGRTLIAILENYQREDGSIEIPRALQPYVGGLKEIKALAP